MASNPCLISPSEFAQNSVSNSNDVVSSSISYQVPTSEELRKIETDIHHLVDMEHLQRFLDLPTPRGLAERACILHISYRSFADALNWASIHEKEEFEVLPESKEIDDIKLSTHLKKLNEKYHQAILNNSQELNIVGQESMYLPHRLEQHGLLDYVGNSYCVQHPLTQHIYIVQYYYTVPDESKYCYPLEEKQLKYGFCYEPVTNSFGEIEYQLKGIHFLGFRINPFSTNYVMCLRSPSTHRTVMTFLAKPNERWTLFFSKPPENGMVQQNDVKMQVETLSFKGESVFNVETKDSQPFTPLEPKEFIPLPHNATLCQVDTTTSQDNQVVAVTQEWVWSQRYLSKKGRVRVAKNIVENPQLSPKEREFYLKHDYIRYSFKDPAFEEWLYEGNIILDKEKKYSADELVEFGAKVLNWVSESIPYTAKEKFRGCGEGGVAFCAQPSNRQTDCGGKALMIAASMRYNNIPARVMQGQFSQYDPNFFQERLANMTSEEARMGFHAMVEYWIDGLGWVPVEATDWRGFTFGRDRNKTMFVRHFDFVYKLHFRSQDEWRTEEPFFVSAFFSVLHYSKEPLSDKEKERQDYMVYYLMDS